MMIYLVTNLENDFNVSQFNSSVSELLQFQILLYVHSCVCHAEAAVFGFVSVALSTDRQLVQPLSTWHWVCTVSAMRTR